MVSVQLAARKGWQYNPRKLLRRISMAGATQSATSEPQTSSAADRLDSWKEIAGYLRRSVRTVHRWESEQGLPVHRHLHQSSGTVYAFKSEIDAWWASRKVELEAAAQSVEESPPAPSQSRPNAVSGRWSVVFGAVEVVVVVAVLAFVGPWRDRLFGGAKPPSIRSIAVLPLENLTGDSTQDYVVDSITDALTTELARTRLLEVTSRTSATQYKGARQSLRKIAKNLNVDAVVEGTVSRNGQRIEINVQLIQASSDRHLWAQRYDRDLGGLAPLPTEIAWEILRTVPANSRPGGAHQSASARPANADAYEAYIKGRYFWSKREPESLLMALKYFDQAIAADPSYAPAYSGLSDTYRMSTNVLASPRDSMPKAEAAARKALELDDSLAEAHASLAGVLYRYHFDWKGAEQEFKRALELDPEYEEAHRGYGIYLVALGRNQEAYVHLQRAAQLSPLSPATNAEFAIALRNLHRFDKSIEQIKKVQEIDPNSAWAQLLLAEDFRRQGDSHRALAALEQAAALSKKAPLPWVGYGFAVLGRKREAEAVLASLKTESKTRYVSPQAFTIVYMGLGNKEQALTYLEKAYEERSFIVSGMAEGRWDVLRPEARFQSILRRMGLPAEGNGQHSMATLASSASPHRTR
jgi:TolB-like protein/Tfp pilus assembly protein PilF